MGIIKSRKEIDYEKLKALLKKKGHGIISPGFFERCNSVFDGKDKETIIFQCDCGEVFFSTKKIANKAIKKFGTENLRCKKCGDDIGKTISGGTHLEFLKLYNYEQIIDIIENKRLNSDNPNFTQILDEINNIDPELVNAKSPNELFYQIHKLNRVLSQVLDEKSPCTSLVKQLIDKTKQNKKEFMKILQGPIISPEEQKNTSLVEIQNNQYKFLKEQTKFYGLSLPFNFGLKEKEMEINSDLNAYNHLVEEKKILDTLFNLVKVSEGLKYSDDPFKNERVFIDNNTVKVKSLKNKILAFCNYYCGKPINLMLNELYKTRLRNSHAHNEYQIRLHEGRIHCKESIEINKFYQLNKKMFEFRNTLGMVLLDNHFKFFPVIRNIKLGYDEPILKGEELAPANERTLSELHIEGYEFDYSNLFRPQLIVKNKKIWCFTPSGVDTFEVNKWSKKWLGQIKKNEGMFNVSFHNIIELSNKKDKNGEIIPILDLDRRMELKARINEKEMDKIEWKIKEN